MVAETEIDDTFPMSQFISTGVATPFRFDRTGKRGGVLWFIRKDVPSNLLKTFYIYDHTESLTIKVNLLKTKWLLTCS